MEWNETATDGMNDSAAENREFRGGVWYMLVGSSTSELRFTMSKPSYEYAFAGFRVASVPEPSAFSLLTVGLGGLAMMQRRRS